MKPLVFIMFPREIVFKLLTCSHISFFVLGGGCPGAKLKCIIIVLPCTVMQLYLWPGAQDPPSQEHPSPAVLCQGTAELQPSRAEAGEQESPSTAPAGVTQPWLGVRVCQGCPEAAACLLCTQCDWASPSEQLTHWAHLTEAQPLQAARTNHKPHTPGTHSSVLLQGTFPWASFSDMSVLPNIHHHASLPSGMPKANPRPSWLWWDLPELHPLGLPFFCFPHAPWQAGSHMLWEKHLEKICRHRFSNRWLFAS